MFNLLSKDAITIQLDCRIINKQSLIDAILNYFRNKNIDCRIISTASIPVIEVKNKKYYVVLISRVGSLVGVQEIRLVPINN
ncbi:hypothetical protein [Clostridium sp. LCP25S3_F8]|uniref:hypothetical protein n=1 Tax=Clostridium sp. LCP25S3_F8 TaxID=3438751 RepID=UPI003F8F072A